jgi:hypothetical protein
VRAAAPLPLLDRRVVSIHEQDSVAVRVVHEQQQLIAHTTKITEYTRQIREYTTSEEKRQNTENSRR